MGQWPLRAGALAAFALGVALILPPTELKSSWTNVHYAVPERVYAASEPAESEPVTFPVSAYPEPEVRQRPSAIERDAAPRESGYAEEMRIAEDDRAYGDGYAWASDREVDDPRACRRFRGARGDGCRDYVASLEPGEEPEERELATSW